MSAGRLLGTEAFTGGGGGGGILTVGGGTGTAPLSAAAHGIVASSVTGTESGTAAGGAALEGAAAADAVTSARFIIGGSLCGTDLSGAGFVGVGGYLYGAGSRAFSTTVVTGLKAVNCFGFTAGTSSASIVGQIRFGGGGPADPDDEL